PHASEQGAGRDARGRLHPRPRPRRRARGPRGARDGSCELRPAHCGRRRHRRARPLQPRLRRLPARGPRPRHRERRGEPHGLSVRPDAVSQIDTLLPEERRYPPPPEFAAQANVGPEIYEKSFDDLWRDEASRLTWVEPWETLCEWELPYAKWYVGGKLNACFNCVDRHVEAGHGDRIAY